MKLKFCKVEVGKSKPQKTLTKKVFKYYFENMGYTRKDFTLKLKLNHRIFTNGLRSYYTAEDIEELRVKKIVKGNICKRVETWDEKLKDIERFIPGFTNLFKENTKENPDLVIKQLILINDEFYKFKKALKPIKKYLNQSLGRLGKRRLNMVSNGLEAKVKFMMDELGIKYICQYKVGKYSYDFKVGNTLIEVDGRQYHNTRDDKPKSQNALVNKFKLLRLKQTMVEKQPLKTRECLKKLV